MRQYLSSQISNLIRRAAIGISKQLNGWIESLKDSKIKGPEFLTKKERDKIAHDKEFAGFDAQMEEFRRKHLEMLEKRSDVLGGDSRMP